MNSTRRRRLGALVVSGAAVAGCTLVAAALSANGSAHRTQATGTLAVRGPLRTAVVDDESFNGPAAAALLRRTRAAGAAFVRLTVDWSAVAPGPQRPTSFDAADPQSPLYRWTAVDREVKLAVAAHLSPILDVTNAPPWASSSVGARGGDGPVRPSAAEFGKFATAIARRYSGDVGGLPRVRYWEVWNEPNVSLYLMPQYVNGRAVAADWYRKLVNAFSDAVHEVHRDNLVVAGELSPFSVRNKYVDTTSPLGFTRSLLCLSAGATPRPTCDDPVRFDAWSVHPYTSGGPVHHAYARDDLSLGDLPSVPPLLRAALRLGHLRSDVPVQFWVTEFSWDTDPPDPNGVPAALQARWVAESLYHAWRDGVSLFTWFTLRDYPLKTSDFQSGLYFRGHAPAADRAKPALTAFRFPFVAYPQSNGVLVWGRTPDSRPGTVVIEARTAATTTTVAHLHANRYGIFSGTVTKGTAATAFRAGSGGRLSLDFALKPPANENMAATPFGVGSRK